MTPGARAASHFGGEASAAIDRSVLGEWLDGDDAAINELLVEFRESVCTEQARMSDVLARGNLDEFASAAHRLRGAALSMGARTLADVAGKLYSAARANDPVACGTGMTQLETQVGLMVSEVALTQQAEQSGDA